MKTIKTIAGACFCFALFSGLAFAGSNNVLGRVKSSIIVHFDEEKLKQPTKISANFKNIFDITRGVRAAIVLNPEEMKKIIPLVQPKFISKEIETLLVDEKEQISMHNRASSLGYTSDQMETFALLSSTSVSWDKGITLLKKLTPEKEIFPKYEFENAVSILFLKIEEPNVLYRALSKKFLGETQFYTNCLAFALKTYWETTRETKIEIVDGGSGQSAAQNIVTQIYDALYHQD